MRQHYYETIKNQLEDDLRKLEAEFEGDVVFYFGPIHSGLDKRFRNFIEDIKADTEFHRNRLIFLINTAGGTVESVERMVNCIRHHYDEVFFVVPDSAMSAGTVLCMSGDKIYMDYWSALGPIDPQVYNGNNWVPALGYLDKVDALIAKSADPDQGLSEAELLMLSNLDLAELRSYEMAKELSIVLLKEWLVRYKFKDWDTHSSSGADVTTKEKATRAHEIARDLSSNSLWHSHGRSIGINTLTGPLRLKIEDYSADANMAKLIRNYNELICEFIVKSDIKVYMHSRVTFY
jgi:Serine dehydrogenase proteinase